jgi:hypothetical protein
MAWIQSSGKACYSGLDDAALSKPGILTIGNMYYISLTISDMTQGKLVFYSFDDIEYSEDGEVSFFAISNSADFTVIADSVLGDMFDGCITSIIVREVPMYQIKDLDNNVVYTSSEMNVSISGGKLQYYINWSDIEEGHYKIYFTDGGLTYESDCLHLKTEHDCTKLLTWSNNDTAFGFDFTEDFTQSLRVNSKMWQPSYKKTKEVFEDSQGNLSILRSSTKKVELLTVSEMPQYLHDALAIGVEHDNFSIDGIPYVVEDEEYTPSWRKSSQLAPVEISVIKKTQSLVNENCV